jgi:chemotaxis protein methyltransferase CheR
MSMSASASEQLALDPDLRVAFLRLIENRAGLRLSDHQARGFERVLRQVLAQATGLDAQDLYNSFISGRRLDLFDLLAASLTVGETHFFRVQPQIEVLREFVLPQLIAQRASARRLSVWSAGSSTGEEPYTVAILLRELLEAPDSWNVRILATDINHQVIETARQGRYREWAFRDTPSDARERWFTRTGDSWELVGSVRSMVTFAHQNLMDEATPLGSEETEVFDLIICRNLTIYFSPEAAQTLYRRFEKKLAPGGWLILGPSDPVPVARDLLESVYTKGAILWRRTSDANRSALTSLPLGPPPAPPARIPMQFRVRARNQGHPGPRPETPQRSALPSSGVPKRTTSGIAAGAGTNDVRLADARPPDARAELRTGMLQLDRGDLHGALSSLRRAAFLEADNPLVQFSLARVYVHLNQTGRARAALMHARRILAAAPETGLVAGGDGISVGELRHGIEAQIGRLQSRSQRA